MTFYRQTASVAVQSEPIPILYSNGSIWVGNFDSASVSRINPVTNTVTATITSAGFLTGPTSLAEDDLGNVWVACESFSSGSVSRIDPATNTVNASIYTANGIKPTGIGMGAGEMWVSFNSSSGKYTRFDTTTLLETYASGTGLGFGYNFKDDGTNVWFDTFSACRKVDPSTNTITSVTAGITATSFMFLHYAFGYIWRCTNDGIDRVNPTTNAVTALTSATSAVVQGITDNGVDIIFSDIAGEIRVVDPTSLAVKQTVTSGNYYWATTFDGSAIWANAYGPSGACHKFINVNAGIFTDGASHL